MKILEMGELVSCAEARGIETAGLIAEAEKVARALAGAIGGRLVDVSNQPGFGGLCAAFQAQEGTKCCPEDVDAADPDGDWWEEQSSEGSERESERYACDNCQSGWRRDQLRPIRDMEQRLTAGGEVPAGECPDCGSLAYEKGRMR